MLVDWFEIGLWWWNDYMVEGWDVVGVVVVDVEVDVGCFDECFDFWFD